MKIPLTAGALVSALAATAALTAPGATAASAPARTATHTYTPPPVTWGPCSSPSLQAAGAECGNVTVPLNYRRPGGAKLQLAVSRIKHKTSDADAQGVMLVNPGGPGGSGLGLSRLGAFVPNGGGDPYDWIGFDPRGVGSSSRALTCDQTYNKPVRPDYVPTTERIERQWKRKTRAYAQDCDAAGGNLLGHVKTTDSAMDMESIRKALGADQINYYGFSYGTYLGSVYATMFPSKLRRAVFDGVVDPTRAWYGANLDQDVAFEKTSRIWFAWIARHDETFDLGTTERQVRNRWYRVLDRSRQAPLGGTVGPAEWSDVFISAGYYVYDWVPLAEIFAEAWKGNYAPVAEAYGTGIGPDNGYAMYLATECTDAPWPQRWSRWERDNWRLHRNYPFLTWGNAWYNAPCRSWGANSASSRFDVRGSAAPPILLIAETNDAATPFSGALEVRRRFPKSVLIEGVDGSTHSGSLSGVSCTDDRIANYLLTGELDRRRNGNNRSDVQCDPVPQPDPTAAAASQRAAKKGMADDLRELRQQADLLAH